MKHLYKTAAALLAAAMLMTSLLTGCGASGPTEKDAKKYVKAVLDLMCTGDYDHSVTFSDVEEGDEQASRNAMIDSIVSSVAEENDLTQEQSEKFREYITQAFATCRYSVKNASKTEDGGYDVVVSIEPLLVFDGVSDALNAKIDEMTATEEAAVSMSKEEQRAALTDTLFEALNKNLEAPRYAPAEEVVVHYGLLGGSQEGSEEGSEEVYGVDEEAASLRGAKLFSSEGM